eukprot:jgi/Botrbrau1/6986/Bobra.0165s0020.2
MLMDPPRHPAIGLQGQRSTLDRLVVEAAEAEMRRKAPNNCCANADQTATRRFDYGSGCLDEGAKGFLITTTFNREKSATTEAISVLQQYIFQGSTAPSTATGGSTPEVHQCLEAGPAAWGSGSQQLEGLRGSLPLPDLATRPSVATEPGRLLLSHSQERADLLEAPHPAPHRLSMEDAAVQCSTPAQLLLGAAVQCSNPVPLLYSEVAPGASAAGAGGCKRPAEPQAPRGDAGPESEGAEGTPSGKKRKLAPQGKAQDGLECPDEIVGSQAAEKAGSSTSASPGGPLSPGGSGFVGGSDVSPLAVIKLACKGLVFLRLRAAGLGVDPVDVVRGLVSDVRDGRRARLKWCQRILPAQTTCKLAASDLGEAGERLALDICKAKDGSPTEPLTYAVSYKSRGAHQAAANPDGADSLPRDVIIQSLAESFRRACERRGCSVKVDLKSPQVVQFAETVPLAGGTGPVCALSILERDLVDFPKLIVKSVGQP